MPHIKYVDIDKASRFILEMQARIEDPAMRVLLDEFEGRMRNFLHGLILTARETGLVVDVPYRLEELRAKLLIALDTGFILGRESRTVE